MNTKLLTCLAFALFASVKSSNFNFDDTEPIPAGQLGLNLTPELASFLVGPLLNRLPANPPSGSEGRRPEVQVSEEPSRVQDSQEEPFVLPEIYRRGGVDDLSMPPLFDQEPVDNENGSEVEPNGTNANITTPSEEFINNIANSSEEPMPIVTSNVTSSEEPVLNGTNNVTSSEESNTTGANISTSESTATATGSSNSSSSSSTEPSTSLSFWEKYGTLDNPTTTTFLTVLVILCSGLLVAASVFIYMRARPSNKADDLI